MNKYVKIKSIILPEKIFEDNKKYVSIIEKNKY